jgi:phosphoribosylanthranilate isomerase
MWIKICANTNLEDAQAAAALGAGAVGFVFAPSQRRVVAEQVAAITRELPAGCERVGVFAGQDADGIVAIVDAAGLNAVQLHGGIDSRLAEAVRRRTRAALIQTISWQVQDPAAEAHVARQLEEVVREGLGERVLIDARLGSTSGGLGVSFDWQRAAPIFASQPALKLIVAGGLRPENVAHAIAILKPWGADVASGVERAPGRKDFDKLRAFIAEASA